jgi:hypothetical protein
MLYGVQCATGLVHDRTVSGEPLVFGDQGGPFMNAMTWWGRVIAGPLKGTELELLPSKLVPWKTWLEAHPQTLALKTAGQGVWHGGVAIGSSLDQLNECHHECCTGRARVYRSPDGITHRVEPKSNHQTNKARGEIPNYCRRFAGLGFHCFNTSVSTTPTSYDLFPLKTAFCGHRPLLGVNRDCVPIISPPTRHLHRSFGGFFYATPVQFHVKSGAKPAVALSARHRALT